MKKILLSLSILIFSSLFSFSQNVYEWYQDGKVVFQINPKSGFNIAAGKDSIVNIKNYDFLNALAENYGIEKIYQKHPDSKDLNLRNTYEIEFSNHKEIEKLIDELGSHKFIQYAEKKERHILFITPNDLGANSTTGQWGLYKIKAQQAWDISTGSTTVIVAVTDDAILTTHADFAGKLVPGRDVANNDNDPNPPAGTNNIGNHGTHVSGTVGATTNNGTGVASIGWNVKVMPVKIGRDSDGALVAGYEGITWAAQNGANVINMSWGGAGTSTYGTNVVNNAFNLGCVLIAAAGNDGVQTQFYPAAYSNVIAVASTTTNDSKSSFSQYGNWITLSAPGSSIRSTVKSGGYGSMSGTSMASPLVSGLAGLIKSVNPTMTPTQIRNCLTSSCDNIDAANPSMIGLLGSGRINALEALLCANASTVSLDAGTIGINSPSGTMCSGSFIPSVVIRNFGSTTLTNVNVNYQLNSGTVSVFNWSGSLTTNSTVTITLPTQTAPSGANNFTVFTSSPNGSIDQNTSNDLLSSSFTVFSSGSPLPFIEDFESNSFATNGWSILNPDNSTTWGIVTSTGTLPGTRSAKMDLYNYAATGQRDAMLTKALDFSGYSNITLTFEHAYRRYNTNSTDSLIIYVSTDCGSTFSRAFVRGENGTGSFATAATSTNNFVPANSGEWCMGTVGSDCFVVDLTAFAGSSQAVVKFESFNNYGNNLYIDNINITGGAPAVPPTASFTASETSVCAGSVIDFTDISTPAASSWSWSFPGGTPSSSTLQNPSVTFNSAGAYNVTLTATNANGSNTSSPLAITVYANPTAPTVSFNGIELVCSATAISYQWYLNGNPIMGASGQTHVPATSGNYTVSITDGNNCSAVSATYVYAPPVASFTANQTAVCAGTTIGFTDTSTPAATSWNWSFPGGTPLSSTQQNPSVTFNSAGTHNVTLTATNANGSNTSSPFAITVYTNPTAPTISFNGVDLICSATATSYQWYLNGAIISGATGQTHVPATAGNYTVSITNSNNCSVISGAYVHSTPPPVASFTASQTAVCAGSIVNFTDTSIPAATSWSWSFQGGTPSTSNQQNPSVTYNNAGAYNATLTATNANGGTTSSPMVITVNANPSAPTISYNGIELECSATAISYQWYFNGNILPGAIGQTHIPATSGDYTVSITNGNNCSATSPFYNHITSNISSNNHGFQLKVYPNPTLGILNIEFSSSILSLQVFNLLGEIISDVSVADKQKLLKIDISGNAPGVYFIRINTLEGKSIVEKISLN